MSSHRPVGRKKQISTAKKQFFKSLQQYARGLEKENRELKTDPNTLIGKVIGEYQKAMTASKRLSVLVATVIKTSGGKMEVKRADLESFTDMLINIKWQVPEGTEKPGDANRYIFTYDAIPNPLASQQQAPAAYPQSPPMPETAPVAGIPQEPPAIVECVPGESRAEQASTEPPVAPCLAGPAGYAEEHQVNFSGPATGLPQETGSQ